MRTSLRLLALLLVGATAACSEDRSEPLRARPEDPGPVSSLPEGGPPALHRAEPAAIAPAHWQFPEAFPRTSGLARLSGGALFWSGFLYDDHGALGAPLGQPPVIFSPPIGTFTYTAGPAHENGADIAAAAVGLAEDSIWLRVDWQTLADPTVPVAMWAFDTDDDPATGTSAWPGGAGISSAGVERWLVISSRGAWLHDGAGNVVSLADVDGESRVDEDSQSFIARVPDSILAPVGEGRIRLVAGVANEAGDGFAPVTSERGALPGQPPVYDVAFRAHDQEPLGRDNWWRDKALALALAEGDVSGFFAVVNWSELAAGTLEPEPQVQGWSNRWYFSSVDLGPGLAPRTRYYASDFLPNYMGRRQPYGVYVPESLGPEAAAPLTVLLHSINVQHNQFINWNPGFIEGVCESRGSICIAPLGRGADGWWANEAELDVWEVWNRVALAHRLDPTRTVLAGYSMGGYGAYRLGLEHPDLFAAVLVLAGAPACSVRLVEGVEGSAASGNRECDQESNTSPLIENARETPFYLGHDALDELAPVSSAVEQAGRFDALGYRHRLEIYANQDHVVWSNIGAFEGAVSWLKREDRHIKADPDKIIFSWYAQHQRADLGTGPGSMWWINSLQAASSEPGFRARVEAASSALRQLNPVVERLSEPVLNADGPATASELIWSAVDYAPPGSPEVAAQLNGVARATFDLPRAGIPSGTAAFLVVNSDGPTQLGLSGLRPGATLRSAEALAQADPSGRVSLPLKAGINRLAIE